MKKIIACVLAVGLTAGCATMNNWEPVVDREVDPHPENVDRDLEQCRQLAKEASGDVGQQAAEGGAVGALGGAVIGTLLGAGGGNAAGSAAAGAVIGGIGGSASQGMGADDHYRRAYIRCMRGRGHHVIV